METFGRTLATTAAVLPIVRPGSAHDRGVGALLLLTLAELEAADADETDDDARTWCRLESGRGAWGSTA